MIPCFDVKIMLFEIKITPQSFLTLKWMKMTEQEGEKDRKIELGLRLWKGE